MIVHSGNLVRLSQRLDAIVTDTIEQLTVHQPALSCGFRLLIFLLNFLLQKFLHPPQVRLMRYLDWTLFLRIGGIIRTGCLCDLYSRRLRGFRFSITLLTISLQFLFLLIRNFSEAIFDQ